MNSLAQNFHTFSSVHLATLALFFFIAILLCFLVRRLKNSLWLNAITWGIAGILIFNEGVYVIIMMMLGQWSYTWGLPLQLCDLALFTICYSLIKDNQLIWELSYFWGLTGTVQALLTPDLALSFPDYVYIKFFIGHGLIVAGVCILAFGAGRPIYFKSAVRVWVVTNVYAVFIFIFNIIFKTNYLYLAHKPDKPSLLDYLGPWPNYILGLEGLLIASLLLVYLPYYFLNLRHQA